MPLIIFQDNILIYGNLAAEKVFSCYSFMLRGHPITDLFNHNSIKKLKSLPDNTTQNIDISTASNVRYNISVGKSLIDGTSILIIKFISPLKNQISAENTNIKLDSYTSFEYIMSHNRSNIDNCFHRLKAPNRADIDNLKKGISNFFEDLSEFFNGLKGNTEIFFEIFDLCSFLGDFIKDFNTNSKNKISFSHLIDNGYVFGNREKLKILINTILSRGVSENCFSDISVSERADTIIISIVTLEKTEPREERELTPLKSDRLSELFAKEAGCGIFSYYVKDRGHKYMLVYDIRRAYRAFEP